MTAPRQMTVDSLGLPLHFFEWGDPGGETILLIHGFLDLAFGWHRFASELLARTQTPVRLVAPDCRGHGDSGWAGPGGYYHFPDYVFDLDCVIRATGVRKCKLIGHSMGGTIAFLYCGSFPDRVSKLVLVEGIGPPDRHFSDAPLSMERWITELHQRGRRHFREYSSVDAGAGQLRQSNPRLSEAFALELARAGMKQNDNGKWVWKFDPLHRTAAPQPFYAGQALEYLRRIECPVLLVDGEESRQAEKSDNQKRYDAIADHRRVVIDAAGHMVHQDNPRRLAEVISAFFEL